MDHLSTCSWLFKVKLFFFSHMIFVVLLNWRDHLSCVEILWRLGKHRGWVRLMCVEYLRRVGLSRGVFSVHFRSKACSSEWRITHHLTVKIMKSSNLFTRNHSRQSSSLNPWLPFKYLSCWLQLSSHFVVHLFAYSWSISRWDINSARERLLSMTR